MTDFFDKAEHEISQRKEAADAKTWEPQAGDVLKGALIEAKVVTTVHGPTIMTVVKEHGTNDYYNVWAGRSRLKSEFLDVVPAIGSLIVLEYTGPKVAEKSGNTYHQYTLVAQTQDFTFWQGIGTKLTQKPSERQAEASGNEVGVNAEAADFRPF